MDKEIIYRLCDNIEEINFIIEGKIYLYNQESEFIKSIIQGNYFGEMKMYSTLKSVNIFNFMKNLYLMLFNQAKSLLRS